VKRIVIPVGAALLIVGCAHQDIDYGAMSGYGGGMFLYGDCLYPDPCGTYGPYDWDNFYPAQGVGHQRAAVILSPRPSATHKVTRPPLGDAKGDRPNVKTSNNQKSATTHTASTNHTASATHTSSSSSSHSGGGHSASAHR
jgi:hypothetical protein